MASSGNFGVWNPLNVGSGGSTSLTVGNTNAVMTGADPRTTGTVGGVISDTDGYYFETVATSTGSGALTLGIVNEDRHNQVLTGQIHSRSGSWLWRSYDGGAFFVETSSNTSYGTFADGDVIGWYVKNSKLYVKKNNSDVVGDVVNTSAGIDISGGFFFPAVSRTVGGGAQTSSILRTDSDDWSYSPPDGFKGLTSKDMLVDSNIDPAQTDSNYGATQFGTVSYTGTGSSNAITGLGFQPDLVWIKRADNTAGWKVTDSTRGVTKVLQPVGNNAEETDSNGLTSFDSDGFTVGSDSSYNASSSKILAYGWRANGGTTSSNTDGSITTTIQTSDSGGFSIIKYTGTGSNATIGHGLSKAPDFMIFKCTTTTDNWIVYHREFGAGNRAQLNNAGIGWGSSSTSFQSTDPDNSVITIGTSSGTNSSSGTMICYAWASIDGYSNFSSYVGNANTDGPFVYTSFLPKMTWFKRNGSGDWIVNTYDENSVDTSYINPAHNPLDNRMLITSSVRATGKPVDFLSNGFKIRHTDSDSNLSGVKYPVISWGSVPFKYNNTF